MFEIKKNLNKIILKYSPDDGDDEWIIDRLNEDECITIKRKFDFLKTDYMGKDEYDNHMFCMGELKDDYFFIRKDILFTNFDVYIHKDCVITKKIFEVAFKNANTFSAINNVYKKDSLYIGGENADIPIEDFEEILKKFPSIYEKDLYVKSRIENIVGSYLEINDSYEKKLNNYINKKENYKSGYSSLNYIDEYDIEKYETILFHLKEMIANHTGYVEELWRNEILKIITLIMPQYIFTLREVSIKMNPKKRKQIDILLVNANGNVDIIEVKRYDVGSLIGKNPDSRGNYKPSSNLSSAIVQAEKYAYLSNTYNKELNLEVIKQIKEKYKIDFNVNVINPKTIIIMGNADDMNKEQKEDFELIRRMYANVIDIITYGDLVKRLENLIRALKNNM